MNRNSIDNKRLSVWILILNFIFFILSVVGMAVFLNSMEWYVQVFAYICIATATVGVVVFYCLKKQSICKSIFSVNGLITFIVLLFVILNVAGIFDSFSDAEKIKRLILDSGSLGVIIFFVALILQVVVLPVPAFIFYVAGTAIYGPLKAFIICYLATVVGSFIAYFIGRFFGRKVVYWCVGKETVNKYEKMLGSKGYLLFAMMQLLPFFPDDVLCMLAGLISMKFGVFSLIIIFIRPIYILLACFFGTGNIIPFSGWGIPVWIGIFILLGALFALYCKHQTRIEAFFKKKFSNK